MVNAVSACIHEKMTAEDIAVFPMGTHPALTASPIAYQLTNAAEAAISTVKKPVPRERRPPRHRTDGGLKRSASGVR